MAQISIIKKSDISEARRFDAEYFKPEYLEMDKKLSKIKTNNLLEFSEKITDFGAYSQNSFINYVKKSDYFFIRNQDVQDFFLSDESKIFIEKTVYEKLTLKIQENDLLLQRTGTIGQTAIALKKDTPASANQNLAQVKLDKGKINPFFVLTYLNSSFGKRYFERLATGNVQPWLNLSQINNLDIPDFPQSFQLQIEKIVKSAHNKQTLSKQLYKEAEQLLLEELDLVDYKPKHKLTFETTRKEIAEAKRYDAEYFQPKYAEIIEKIEKYEGGFDVVENHFKQNKILSKKNKEFYNYIEISDVNVSNGEIISNKIELKNIPANGKRKLFKDDLLISKVRPYRGAISFIDFEAENLLGSGAFTVLQEKTEYKKEVLMIFLKTIFIKELLLRYNCGTSYPVIKDEDILSLKIPLIKPQIQTKIAEKIKESHKLRKESKELLEEAKRKVEEEIEK